MIAAAGHRLAPLRYARTVLPVVLIHGLGQTARSWAQVQALLANERQVMLVEIPTGADFTLAAASDAVLSQLDDAGVHRGILCGLSLGAMVGIQVASSAPSRVAGLALSGVQLRPPKVLMRVQRAIMRVLPARLVAPPGLTKRDMLAVLDAVSDVDLTEQARGISAPTLVMCGARDRPNLAAARAAASEIPGAELQIIEGAGHEWNLSNPAEFARRLDAFAAHADAA